MTDRDDEFREIKARLRGDIMNAFSGGSTNGGGRALLMQVLQGLILAGIVALIGVTWDLSKSVSAISVTLSEREKQNAKDIARLESADDRHDIADGRHDTEIRGLDNRVTELERGKSAYQPNPNHRQERR